MSDPHVLSSRKIWVPLENNPTVMTRLAHRLGLSKKLKFEDLYSLTEASLLAMVPRPVLALLFLFPITHASEKAFHEEEDAMEQYDSAGPEQPVMWFHQTIGHACGLMGLLHCMTNGEAASRMTPRSDVHKLFQAAISKKPTDRAALLYNSDILEIVHGESAKEGDSRVPDALDDVPHGFTAFVKGKDGHLWELEGRRKGPVDRGLLDENEDVLSEKALQMGPLRYINNDEAGEIRFSCLALVDS